jgi:hypothetical protein
VPFDVDGISVVLPDFLAAFVTQNVAAREATPEETDRDRRWYFEPHGSNTAHNNKGWVRYGISGFESDLVDSKTNKREFQRKTTHVEIIPLFYEFWFPSGFNHGFAAFQSFAARSCVELVSAKMRTDFANENPGFTLHFKKLLPTGVGGIYDSAPVKGLRLIKRNASSDVADRYLNAQVGYPIDFHIVINARRKGRLGRLGDLINSMKAAAGGVITHDGVTFDEAVAEIDFGGQRRRVGVLGSNSEAGVIDLTDVKRSANGHPLFADISKESTSLLADFQGVIGKSDRL